MVQILLSAAIGYLTAKLIKFTKAIIRKQKKPLNQFFVTGGMPSAHTTTTAALATSIFLVEGLASTAFAISIIFYLIVFRDAIGVRRTVGELGELTKKDIHKSKGHTIPEVTIGTILGIAISLCLHLALF
jgi:uncharacterized protein